MVFFQLGADLGGGLVEPVIVLGGGLVVLGIADAAVGFYGLTSFLRGGAGMVWRRRGGTGGFQVVVGENKGGAEEDRDLNVYVDAA